MDGTEGLEHSRLQEEISFLLDNGKIGHPTAIAIASVVKDKGIAALKGGQKRVFDRFISPHLRHETCCVCGQDLGPMDDKRLIGPDEDICCARHVA